MKLQCEGPFLDFSPLHDKNKQYEAVSIAVKSSSRIVYSCKHVWNQVEKDWPNQT